MHAWEWMLGIYLGGCKVRLWEWHPYTDVHASIPLHGTFHNLPNYADEIKSTSISSFLGGRA